MFKTVLTIWERLVKEYQNRIGVDTFFLQKQMNHSSVIKIELDWQMTNFLEFIIQVVKD